MKQLFFFLFLLISPCFLFAQQTDSTIVEKDSVIHKETSLLKNAVSVNTISRSAFKKDSIIKGDSLLRRDSIIRTDTIIKKDTLFSKAALYNATIQNMLKDNRYLNSTGRPIAMSNQIKKGHALDSFFYLIAALAMLLGFFRFFYTRYFNNLFRVFFNASLRQSQLTDQLLQAKLPSLFFNLLFILTGGVYAYLLLRYYNWITAADFWPVLIYCTVSLAIIYFIKFITLKFTGWLTGFKEVTNTYVFIIFLINKILGILLLPFTIIIAFSMPVLATAAVIISLLFVSLMFLLRFFRSYGLLQHQLKVSRFHFLMYVAGIEIVPVLLIYKGLVILLTKNI